jgi:hypothetical protein
VVIRIHQSKKDGNTKWPEDKGQKMAYKNRHLSKELLAQALATLAKFDTTHFGFPDAIFFFFLLTLGVPSEGYCYVAFDFGHSLSLFSLIFA